MQWSHKEPSYGDIVRVKVNFYYHYGIFENENSVIQFGLPDNSGISPDRIQVISTPVTVFSNGSFVETATFSHEEKKKKRTPEEIIRLATSRIGEGNYHILHNNCEHFVTDCVFGEKVSFLDSVREQIRNRINKKEL